MEVYEDRLIRLPEVCRLTGLSRSTIYRLMKQNRFPKNVFGSDRASVWRLREVMAWIGARDANPPGTWQ